MLRAELVDLRGNRALHVKHPTCIITWSKSLADMFWADSALLVKLVFQSSQPDIGSEEHHKGTQRYPHLATSGNIWLMLPIQPQGGPTTTSSTAHPRSPHYRQRPCVQHVSKTELTEVTTQHPRAALKAGHRESFKPAKPKQTSTRHQEEPSS